MKSSTKENIKFITLFILIIGITAVIIGGSSIYTYLNGFNSKDNIVEPNEVKNDNSPVNILLAGVDIGNGQKNISYSRTDTLILLNYNPKEEKLSIISIPRDTLIQINNKNDKINSASVYGGPKLTIAAVEDMLNIDVNYYAYVDYSGFRNIVDIIGGIDMEIKNNMDYDDTAQNLHIHFNKGESIHLDGKKAEEFFRWRKNNDGTGLAMGDLDRIANQHEFINKVIEKLKSPSMITKIPSVLSAMPKYIKTNMNGKAILKYGLLFSDSLKKGYTISTLKGDIEYLDGVSYFVYDEKQNKDLISKLN